VAPTVTDFNAAQQTMGLTRAEMAQAMGVHYETLAKWQRGAQHPPAAAVTLVNLLLWLHEGGQLDRWRKRQAQCS
jgi:DNA-binding transcriptional regulator YiaG